MDFSTFSPALVLVTVVSLALAPFVAVMVTSFTKIVVVLSLLRNALGLQQVPPNVVINGLAIVLSIYVMYPVLLDTHAAVNARMEGKPMPASIQADIDARAQARAKAAAAATPSSPAKPATTQTAIGTAPVTAPASPAAADALQAEAEARGQQPAAPRDPSSAEDAAAPAPAEAPPRETTASAPPPLPKGGRMDTERLLALVEAGKEPLRTFLINHSNDAERAFFLKSAQRLLPPARRGELSVDDFIVVVPAFTVSELTAAFQIGFLIFLPFLIIDLVVANILLALGMMMMSPTTVSLPFKLLLFVLIDGWAKLVHGLVLTYG
ncbi:FliP-like protein [Luteimonas cucumeris]|uniref:FliP-like protein n=1 Tax=Luteimonas cucumeris TaxID=985012 RepID=A0A562KVS8_9GAMM|nr:EscR/YscR/HrcR family type III secretion system export apparatus protein [Luteimonas cucumeris]TWH99395.1 FliP-like protein [Luteimonas cucumeris]